MKQNILQFLTVLSLLNDGATQFVQPNHASSTQQASLICFPRGDDFVMQFTIIANQDPIAIVYLVDPQNPRSNTINRLDSLGNGITGVGSISNPYRLEIVLRGPIGSLTAINANVIGRMSPVGVVDVYVMAKSRTDLTHIIFPKDVLWRGKCNFNAAATVSAVLSPVIGSIIEGTKVVAETPVMEVKNSAGISLVSTVIGSEVYLNLGLNPPTTATGIYAYDCFVCNTQLCTGAAVVRVINENGCPVMPIIIDAFRLLNGETRTPLFEAFAFDVPIVFFQCTVGFCYSPAQTECTNYCAFNTNGRRKRQTRTTNNDSGLQNITTSLEIQLFTHKKSELLTEVESGDTKVLMTTVITLAVVLTLVLVIVVIIFVNKYKGWKSDEHVPGIEH